MSRRAYPQSETNKLVLPGIIEKLEKEGKLNENEYAQILKALEGRDRKLRALAAHACSFPQDKLSKEILDKLVSISSAKNKDLNQNALKAIRNSVRDHLQPLDDAAIGKLCDNALGPDPIAAHDAMFTLRLLAEQERKFDLDHEEHIIDLLQDDDKDDLNIKIVASEWLWCIIRNGHCLSEESIKAMLEAIQTYDNCLPIQENCLSALEFLRKFRTLPEEVTKILESNAFLKMYRIRRECKKYDSALLYKLCDSLRDMNASSCSLLSVTNAILAIQKLIQMKPGKLEIDQIRAVKDALSTVRAKENNHAFMDLQQELKTQEDVQEGTDRERVFDAEDSNIMCEVRQEVVSTTEHTTKIRHYQMEAMVEDYEDETEEDAAQTTTSQSGKETTPGDGDEQHNWDWYRTTHSQLWKYQTRIKKNQKLAEGDIEYIADKMLNPNAWRTSLDIFSNNVKQEMEELIGWLLASLAKNDVALPQVVLEKCQNYVKGKLPFTPSKKDEYNQHIITILNKFIARGEMIDKDTIKEIASSYKDYPETVLLLDSIADQDDVEVVELEGYMDKILSEDPETRMRICHIFFCASKRNSKVVIKTEVLRNLLKAACDGKSEIKTRCHAIAAISEYGKKMEIDSAVAQALSTELQKGDVVPLRVKKNDVLCLWKISEKNKFDNTTLDHICESVCKVHQWDEKLHAYLLQTLVIQIEKHKNIPSPERTEDLSLLLRAHLSSDTLMKLSQILFDIIKTGQELTATSLEHFVTYLLSDEPELSYTVADAFVTYLSSVHIDVWKENDKCLDALSMIYTKPFGRKLKCTSITLLQTLSKFRTTLPQSVVDVLCISLQDRDEQIRRASSQSLALYSTNSDHHLQEVIMNEIGNNLLVEQPNIQVHLIHSLMNEAYKKAYIPDEVISQLNLVMLNTSTRTELRSMVRILLEMLEYRQQFPEELHKHLNAHSDLLYLTNDEAEDNYEVIAIATRLKKTIMKEDYVMLSSDISRLIPQTNVSNRQAERYLSILHSLVKRHQYIPNNALRELQAYFINLGGRIKSSRIEDMIVGIAKNKQQIEHAIIEKLSISNRLEVYEVKSRDPPGLSSIEIEDALKYYGKNCPQVLKILEHTAGLGHILSDSETKVIKVALGDHDRKVVMGALKVVTNISIQPGTTDRFDANIIDGLNHVIQTWPGISDDATNLLNKFNHARSTEANYLCELHNLLENLVSESLENQLKTLDHMMNNPMIGKLKVDKCIPLLSAPCASLCSKALELLAKATEEGCFLTPMVINLLQCLLFNRTYETQVIDIFVCYKRPVSPEIATQVEESFIHKAMQTEIEKNHMSVICILKGMAKANKTPSERLKHFLQTDNRINNIIELCKQGKHDAVVAEYAQLCTLRYNMQRPTMPIVKIISLANLLNTKECSVQTIKCATDVLQKILGYHMQEICTQVASKLVLHLKKSQSNLTTRMVTQAINKIPVNHESLEMILQMVNANTIHVVKEACKWKNFEPGKLSSSFYDEVLNLTTAHDENVRKAALQVLFLISSKTNLPGSVINRIQALLQDPTNPYCIEMILIVINHLRHVESDTTLETLVSDILNAHHQETAVFMSKFNCSRDTKFSTLSTVLQCECLPSVHTHLMKSGIETDCPLLGNIDLLKQAAGITNIDEKEMKYFKQLISESSTHHSAHTIDSIFLSIIQKQLDHNLQLTLAEVNDILMITNYAEVTCPEPIEVNYKRLTKENFFWLLRQYWLRGNVSMPSAQHFLDIESMTIRQINDFVKRTKEAEEYVKLEMSTVLICYFQKYGVTQDDWKDVIDILPDQVQQMSCLHLALSEVLFLRELQKIWPDSPDKMKEIILALLQRQWRVESFFEISPPPSVHGMFADAS